MLTTTLDGLWVLQVLTGIEVLAPELGLRPHLPSAETRQQALAHPIAAELRDVGVIATDGAVDQTVREWLTVLSRRDVAVLMYVQTPGTGEEPERILLARFAQWWVSLERCGIRVRISGAGAATEERAAGLIIGEQIDRLCGVMPPAAVRPATIDTAEIRGAVTDPASLRTFLLERGFDGDQVAVLSLAADSRRSAQASVVAIQAGLGPGPARSHIERGIVTIIDTPRGRLISQHLRSDGKSWMIVGPGSPGHLVSAVLAMMRNLPAGEQWHSHRKVV